jgi:hypothetical protein
VKKNTEEVPVRMSPRRADALEHIVKDMSLYDGVKLLDIMEAVYDQGRKDGARAVFEMVEAAVSAVKSEIPHRAPGRPKKR